MDELLKKLNITSQPEKIDENTYVVTLRNSDEYSRVFSILDDEESIELDPESVVLDHDNSEMHYTTSDNIKIDLKADFIKDDYTVTITEVK